MKRHADALESLPGVTAKLLDRSRLTFSLLDPSHRLLEDFGDLDFVLDCRKPSSEPRQEIAKRLEQALI